MAWQVFSEPRMVDLLDVLVASIYQIITHSKAAIIGSKRRHHFEHHV
jgi:hypothetical protein